MNRTFRNLRYLGIVVILFLPLAARAATVEWTPVNGEFNNPLNWTPNPTSGDDFLLSGIVPAQLGVPCTLTPNNVTIGATADGELAINNGGSLTLTGMLSLSPSAFVSTLRLSGDAQLSVEQLGANLVEGGGGTANLILAGTSSTTIRNSGVVNLNRDGRTNITLKDDATFTSSAVYTGLGYESGGAVAPSGTTIFTIQDRATANLGIPLVGDNGSSDSLRVTGGTANLMGTADVKYVGLWTDGYGEVNVSGGVLNTAADVTYGVSLALGGWAWMSGHGMLTVSGTGVVNSAGAYITANGGSIINVGAAGVGGGTIQCKGITTLGGAAYATVNFHGGTFELEDFLYVKGGDYPQGAINIYSEGANIHVDEGTANIYGGLTAPAGKGVTMIPITDGGSGYTVAPLVKIFSYDGITLSDTTAVAAIGTDPLDSATYGKVTGINITNPGTNYVDWQQIRVKLLGGDGSGAVVGNDGWVELLDGVHLADNVSGGMTKTGAGNLVLHDHSSYAGTTTVQEGTLSVLGGMDNSPIVVKSGAALALGEWGATTPSLTLGDDAGLQFSFVDGYCGVLSVAGAVAADGAAPVSVMVDSAGSVMWPTVVLSASGGISENVTFSLPGGLPLHDSPDGVNVAANVSVDYFAGTVTLLGGVISDPTWSNAAGGSWNDSGNWTGAVPNGGDRRAMFTGTLPPENNLIAVNLNVSPQLSSMVFASPVNESYTITPTGANSITLHSTIAHNWHISVLSGEHTVAANMALAAGSGQAAIRLANGSHLTLSGVLSDETTPAAVTVTNGGLLTYVAASETFTNEGGILELVNAANTFSGALDVTGGVLRTKNFPVSASNAPIVLNSCELQYTGTTSVTTRPFEVTGVALFTVSNTDANLSFSGDVTSSVTGMVKAGAGTLTFDGTAEEVVSLASALNVQNGTLAFGGNSKNTVAASLHVGINAATAALKLGGASAEQFASLSCGDAAWFGIDLASAPDNPGPQPSHATIEMSGYAELNLVSNESRANSHFGWGAGSSVLVTMSGNSKLVHKGWRGTEAHGLFDLGDSGSTAEFTLDDSASVSVPYGQVKIGGNYLGLVPGGHGTVTLNDSATFSAGRVVLVGESRAQGTINLNGGVFSAPAFVAGAVESVATINFDGGTLQATPVTDENALYYYDAPAVGGSESWATGAADFIQGTNFVVNVKDGGAKIDTNGLEVTITQNLQHASIAAIDGGLTKLGEGSLTLTVAPTYNGDTTVEAGSLLVPSIDTPLAAVSVKAGASLTVTSIVANTLSIGGAPSAAAVPEPSTLILLGIAVLSWGTMIWRKK